MIQKIGFGGGCHWCTEAYFQSLKGVEKVEQGWIGGNFPNDAFSEAVVVHYDPNKIPLKILIAIHLHTHAATKKHRFREKYRSAVYLFDQEINEIETLIAAHQTDFEQPIITQTILFKSFRLNKESQQDYYLKNKEGIFCERYIAPKLKMIEMKYGSFFQKI